MIKGFCCTLFPLFETMPGDPLIFPRSYVACKLVEDFNGVVFLTVSPLEGFVDLSSLLANPRTDPARLLPRHQRGQRTREHEANMATKPLELLVQICCVPVNFRVLKLHRHGYAGFVDEEGFLYIMSRSDDVINVAGHRLSAGALEEVRNEWET